MRGVGSLRVALLHTGGAPGAAASELSAALTAGGCDTRLIGGSGRRAAERLLSWRGFVPGLSGIPASAAALHAADPDVVHAFDPVAAAVALVWSRYRSAPVVCSFAEPIERSTVADRRSRLRLLTMAVEESDVVLATSNTAAAALRRWLAVDARVLATGDVGAHLEMYRGLMTPAAR